MPTLRWLTRDADVRATEQVPYKLLEEVPELGYGDATAGNMLIQGDNLEALKALLPYYAGQVKCIYIDPPYNTGSAFEHYDDNLEHSKWLAMMWPRLDLLREFLTEDGVLFVQIDDNEGDYLKVILDEVFGRKNFVSRISVKTRSPSAFSTVNPGVFKSAEYLLWYSKNRTEMEQHRVWVPRASDKAYDRYIENITNDPSEWIISNIKDHAALDIDNYSIKSQLSKLEKFYTSHAEKIIRTATISDSGAGAETVSAKYRSIDQPDQIIVQIRDGYDPVYVLNGEQILFYSKNVHEIDGRRVPSGMLTNIWNDISWEGIANEGKVKFPKGKNPSDCLREYWKLPLTQATSFSIPSLAPAPLLP